MDFLIIFVRDDERRKGLRLFSTPVYGLTSMKPKCFRHCYWKLSGGTNIQFSEEIYKFPVFGQSTGRVLVDVIRKVQSLNYLYGVHQSIFLLVIQLIFVINPINVPPVPNIS